MEYKEGKVNRNEKTKSATAIGQLINLTWGLDLT